ncbi:sulfonate transport system ATP-binding protein [Paracoccus aminovorans]|uniref:Sulfonate transport system ATP-binding protein n=1 Tax=Paracoccus aminovorans TaxID=34004 RepID=A0A1I2ZYA1_9RHOB|nr:ABC transporter ATP-binding protein [Paracoccus aminovorans]CQR84434.1 Aliphatic sulfonates import ATP-binding protein SsuB [Paracoccus aminovorans]SFH42650.1 sulfonate transport system ATP-binding protein [Paracoccus aminovorans]
MPVADLLPRDIPVPPRRRAGAGGAAVEARALGRSFAGNRVLANLDLAVRPGEFLSIVGKSGCGKSTLLRMIAGLDRPSSGRVTVDGIAAHAAGGRLRIMFQEPRLLPWASVARNVAVGLRSGPDPKAVAEALGSVQLADKADAWPAQLSGGQRQRAALARALVSHPALLLLDEPLGALDALTRLTMQRLIRDMHDRAGFTAILVTHDVAEAVALSDRIIVLGQGGILQETSIPRAGPAGRSSAELAAIEAGILDAIFAA